MHVRSLILIFGLGLLSAPAALAAIYKWVDDSGGVHYTQIPPVGRPSQLVKPYIGASEQTQPAAQSDGGTGQGGAAKEQPSDSGTAATQQLAAEHTAALEKNCEISRNNLKLLSRGGRLQVRDQKGNPSLLSDEQIRQKLAETRKYLQENCQ